MPRDLTPDEIQQEVSQHVRLVGEIAKAFLGRGLDREDLVQEGVIGLTEAVQRFDPTRGVQFSTYAAHWIKRSIREAIVKTGPTVRLPNWIAKAIREWHRAESDLGHRLGRVPKERETAAAMGLSVRRRRCLRPALVTRREWFDISEAIDHPSVPGMAEAWAELAEDLNRLHAALGRLDARSRRVIELRYGLTGGDPLTFREVGAVVGLSYERVRHIERDAMASLRRPLGVAPPEPVPYVPGRYGIPCGVPGHKLHPITHHCPRCFPPDRRHKRGVKLGPRLRKGA